MAAYYGKEDIVLSLLQNGADPNIKNDDNKTASEIAKEKGYSKIVSLIGNIFDFDYLNWVLKIIVILI